MTDFERQLQGQHFREFARNWRAEILDKAESAARAAERSHSKAPMINWLWPSPIAWGSLAAIWMLLLALDGAGRSPARHPAAAIRATQSSTLFALQTPAAVEGLLR
ncbi:MAG: hypothetical protein JWL90_3508 [Chthoniobacteraceae bacterium]|nr:hypothetical protein [Chthoniobacteraceae bacterium]